MEAKKHTTTNESTKKSKQKIKKYLETNNDNTIIQNLCEMKLLCVSDSLGPHGL